MRQHPPSVNFVSVGLKGVAVGVAGTVVVVGAAAGLVVAAIGGVVVVARREQLDGDGYGAIVEITFVAILAGIAVAAS